MKIRGLLANSFVDFPGCLAAVVWTPGCNFRCPFCYNRELVLTPEELPPVAVGTVLELLERQRPFLGGLVVTGGEPTLQPSLAPFLEQVVARGVRVKLDTNGARPAVVASLARRGLVHYLALDVKSALEPAAYAAAAGLSPARARAVVQRVGETIDLLYGGALPAWEMRTTLVPGLVEEAQVMSIARFCRARCPGDAPAGRYVLQNFFPAPTLDRSLAGRRPLTEEALAAIRDRAAPFFGEVIARGSAAAHQ